MNRVSGTLHYYGNEYYIVMDENKTRVTWFLISKYHVEDRMINVTGGEAKHPIISMLDLMRKTVDTNYIVEAVDRVKIKGTVSVFRGNDILTEVLRTVTYAQAYYFNPEFVYLRETAVRNGKLCQDFSGSDDKLTFAYRKRERMFDELRIETPTLQLDMNSRRSITLPTRTMNDVTQPVHFKEMLGSEKKKLKVLTVNSLDYAAMREILDMSWYENETGKLKDYGSVTNIKEFEEMFDQIIAELYRCRSLGKKLLLGLDTETTGLIIYDLDKNNPDLDKLVAIPISWEDHQGRVIFIDMEYFPNVDLDYVLHRLRALIEDYAGDITIERRKAWVRESKPVPTLQSATSFAGPVSVSADIAPADIDPSSIEWQAVGTYKFDRDEVQLVGHNIMFDGRVFYHYGLTTKWHDDTLQMAFNLNPKVAKGSNKLKNLTRRIFGHETPELSDILGKGNEGMYRWIQDPQVAIIYGCADTDYTRLVYKHLEKITSEEMLKAYRKQDIRIMHPLFVSEYHGMQTNYNRLVERAEIVENDLEIIRQYIYNYVGAVVDYRNKVDNIEKKVKARLLSAEEASEQIRALRPDPTKSHEFELKGSNIREIIYDVLGYPVKGWTNNEKKRERSVDKHAMRKLQAYKLKEAKNVLTHDILSSDPRNKELSEGNKIVLIEADEVNKAMYPMAYLLSRYGELQKEWTSYYKPMREQQLEGKIFKGYSLARIETRRIMNPGQTMKGDLKALITPYSDDYYLADFDQSQVEYRIMASIAQFFEIIEKMSDPEKDYHTETAAMMNNIPAHTVTKKLRKETKGISFGVPYGLGEYRMCENLFGEVTEENLFKTRMLLDRFAKQNAPIMKMLEDYRNMPLEEVDLPQELRDFICLKDEDKGVHIPYGKVSSYKFPFYRMFDLRDLDRQKIGKIRRPSGNFPIQNFAAELFRIILMRFYDRCKAEGIADKIKWHMLIHDELLFSVHKDVHPFYLYKLLYESCVVTLSGHTTYYIGINIGDNWYDCKKDSNEAPVKFVERVIARWDAGEFRDDDYRDDVKGYVAKHKQEYVKQRIYEVLKGTSTDKAVQADIDTAPVNIPLIMENFTNYTVRSYIEDFFPVNGQLMTDDYEEQYIGKLESWAIQYFGAGKEFLYPDGRVEAVYPKADINIDLEDMLSDYAEDEAVDDGGYWDLDSDDFGESQVESYAYSLLDDGEEEDIFAVFDTDKVGATSIADLLVTNKPVLKYTRVRNNQLLIEVKRKKDTIAVKRYLQNYTAKDGLKVLFKTPIGSEIWEIVDKSISLEDLDSHLLSINEAGGS